MSNSHRSARNAWCCITWFKAIAIGCLGVLLAGCDGPRVTPLAPEPAQVIVAEPIVQRAIDWDTYTGRTEAKETTEVRARVYGYLKDVHFVDGQFVKKDDLLFEIDPSTYAALNAQDKSKIGVWRSKLDLAEKKLAQNKKLLLSAAVSKETFDESIAAREEAAAYLVAAEEDEKRSRLDLEFTKIVSPINGRIDRALITQGNLVQGGPTGSTLLTTIVSIDPMYVYFDVDERAFLKYLEKNPPAKSERNADGVPIHLRERKIPIQLALANDDGFPLRGTLNFASNRVDSGTGTLRLRGEIANSDGKLTPGLFLRVRISCSAPYDALIIPQRAIAVSQNQQYVYVVDEKNQAQRRVVELGTKRGSWRVVSHGLKAGEKVVVEGLQRLREGEVVVPRAARAEEIPPPPAPDLPTESAEANENS